MKMSQKILSTFNYKPVSSQYNDTPTSVDWEFINNGIVSGYVNSNTIVHFDNEYVTYN